MKRALLSGLVLCAIVVPTWAEEEEEFELLKHEIAKSAAPRAKITAQQAVEAASKQAPGARLAELELSLEGDTPVFELGFLTDKGAREIKIDAVTGKSLDSEDEEQDADEAEENGRTAKGLAQSKLTLMQAIETAMKEVKGGTVVEAEAEVEDGKFEIEVELLVGDTFKEVAFDAAGKVKKVEEEKAEGQAWTFDADPTGKLPAGWKAGFTNAATGKATWAVAKDPKSMSGPNVLNLSAESGGGTFNLAMAEKTSYQDVDVRTRLRPNTGKEDQGGGLIWRCKDENNYYICRMNPLEGNFRVYKVVNGKRMQLQGVEARTEPGKWHVVRAKMVGNRIICYLGEKKMLDVTDDEFKDAGMVGLWTKADASSSFDNIAVRRGKLSRHDAAVAKPAEGNKKDHDGDDDDDDDDDQASEKKP